MDFQKPGGIIALLDEACMLPRSTHETFAQKLYQSFKNNKCFSKPKLSRTDFTICHYAGDVTYQTELFLEKNRDYVVVEHQVLLAASKCFFISSLFLPSSKDASKPSKFSSISSKLKQQLQALLETLNATEPHYIRCIKPNNLLKPSVFENHNVLQQFRCGILSHNGATGEPMILGRISAKAKKMPSSTVANYSFSIYLLTNDRGADRVEPLRCVLRQRDVFSSPIKSMQEHLSTPITPTKQYLGTGQLEFEELKVANVYQSVGPALRDIANSDAKLRRSSMERMQEEFEEYAEKAKTLPDTTTNENKLILYGLFKQVTVGSVNTSRPGIFNLRDRAKWDAWKAVEGKSKEEAMTDYITKVKQLLEEPAAPRPKP